MGLRHPRWMSDSCAGQADRAHPAGTATLLLRVWFDPGTHAELRARLLSVVDGGTPTTWSVTAGDAALASDVTRWVSECRTTTRPTE